MIWKTECDLEDKITASKQNIGKRVKSNDNSLRDLWGNVKNMNIHIIGVPEGKERQKGLEKASKDIIAGNFLNMEKEIVKQVEEAQRFLSRTNPRRNTARHIVIKLTKNKDKDNILTD